MQVKLRKGSKFTKERTQISHLKQNQNGIEISFSYGTLLKVSVAIRLTSVFLVQTYFVPDEYWQSIEIAHLEVFGYGYKTWEWIECIRGYAYPALFMAAYKVLWIFGIDYTYALINAPRILQALLSACADVQLFMFSKRMFGRTAATYTYILHLSSWFVFYTGSRTLTNTTELALIIISLGTYNWRIFCAPKTVDEGPISLLISLIFCGLSCILRPTAVITWLPVLLFELYCNVIKKKSCYFLKIGTVIALSLFTLTTLLDYFFYGKFVIVHWRFLQFNFIQDNSGFYGTHPWHWYFTQGIPVVLFPHFPLVLLEISYWMRKGEVKTSLILVIFLQLTSLSLVKHKEFRFLLPSVPFLGCMAGKGLYDFIEGFKEMSLAEDVTADSKQIRTVVLKRKGIQVIAILVVINILLILYTGLFHQRGTIDVMEYLRNDLRREGRSSNGVLFLMPCHSTPYYSHLHMNISMRFLECQPNMQVGKLDEADQFYFNSKQWLDSQFAGHSKLLPSHIVMFNVLLENTGVTSFLKSNGFVEDVRLFHSHFPEGRVGSHVLVFSRIDT